MTFTDHELIIAATSVMNNCGTADDAAYMAISLSPKGEKFLRTWIKVYEQAKPSYPVDYLGLIMIGVQIGAEAHSRRAAKG